MTLIAFARTRDSNLKFFKYNGKMKVIGGESILSIYLRSELEGGSSVLTMFVNIEHATCMNSAPFPNVLPFIIFFFHFVEL